MSHAFPYLLALGTFSALAWIGLRINGGRTSTRQLEAAVTRRIDGFLAGFLCAMMLARLSFVALHWPAFRGQPLDAIKLWEGGLTGWGGGLGALVGLWTYCRWTGAQFWQLIDDLAIPASLLVFTAWVGCLLDGCAYGRSMEPSWWTPYAPDLLGLRQPRVPTQSLGALASAGWVLGLQRWREGSWPLGTAGTLALGGHSLTGLVIGLFRADPVPYLGNLRSDQVGLALLLVVAVFVFTSRLAGARD